MHAEGVPQYHLASCTRRGFKPSRTKKCKTNPIATPAWHPERRAAEQSAAAQSRGTCQNTIAEVDSNQTNPVRCHFHETNPIYTPRAPFPRTELNLVPLVTPFQQNEPNSSTPSVQPPPKNAKRTLKITQAAGLPPLYLTPVFQPGMPHNPIMQNEPNLHPTPTAHAPKMQNEPNSRIPGVQPPPKNAKRTQFAHTTTLHPTKNTKRTQSQPDQQPIANSQKLFLRNEPNYHPAPPFPSSPLYSRLSPLSRATAPRPINPCDIST